MLINKRIQFQGGFEGRQISQNMSFFSGGHLDAGQNTQPGGHFAGQLFGYGHHGGQIFGRVMIGHGNKIELFNDRHIDNVVGGHFGLATGR